MCCEPTGERLAVAVGVKSEYALLVAEVGICGLVAAYVAIAAADNAGYDLVAYFNGVSCGVALNVFAKSDDLACTLVSESYGYDAEGVLAPFVNVCSAYSASFSLYENIVVLKSGNGEFFNFNFLGSGKRCNLGGFGDSLGAARAALRCHFTEDLAYYALNLRRTDAHLSSSFLYMMRKLSLNTQRRYLVKLLALVMPSPVGPAMVKVV
jgi:hypothetical protein